MITFENFKDTVTCIDYLHMFPDTHFEEADYHKEPMQLTEDLDTVFGIILDLLYEEIYYATDKDTRPAAYVNRLCSTRETLRTVHYELTEMLNKHYEEECAMNKFESRIGDSNDPYEIRIFWDDEGEYVDDADYLTGLSDVKVRAFYPTADDLMRGWYELLKTNEGDTYCVLDHGSPIASGVYDPNDYEFLFQSLYNLDLSIPVCVYASSTGLYTPDECDYDNLTSITFPTDIVWKWYNENVRPNYEPDAPEADFITWYKEEYTADDTDELYAYAKDHGFTGKRPDGFERKDVELAETIVDHVDSATAWWDKLDVDAVLQMLSTTEGCKHIINELLCHIDLGTKVDLPLRKED